uniref:C protein n=1 Tax=Gainesville rodent jeilong virus 1 TaxID=3163281 RepID=A0AAU7T2I1_9MONO
MESRLSILYNRIRRTFRRPTAEAPLKNQPQKSVPKPGKLSQLVRLPKVEVEPGLWETERQERKELARLVLDQLDQMEESLLRPLDLEAHTLEIRITRLGMLRIVLGLVEHTGEIPDLNTIQNQQMDFLDPEERQSLESAIRLSQLILKTTTK